MSDADAHDTLHYCYAVARPFHAEDVAALRGVRGAPVELIAGEGVVAVTSRVRAAEFSESALRASLEDLGWLEEVARAHNAVVDHVAGLTVTLPFRIATIYLDPDRVREVLRVRRERLTAALDRLDGRVEWGVKVYTVESEPTASTDDPDVQTGRSYLRKRLEQRNSREGSLQRAAQIAEDVDVRLSQLAEDRYRHPAQHSELSRASGQNVLNVAYLVPAADDEKFAAHVAELGERHQECRIELTGPWAPYSFAVEHIEEEDAGER